MRRHFLVASSRLKAPHRHDTPLGTPKAASPPTEHSPSSFTSTCRLTSPTLSSLYPFEFLEDAEIPRDYKPRGFYLISIGDTSRDEHYRVIHKLGWWGGGWYSTVGLAGDEKKLDCYVTIKVFAADAPSSD